jgi:hypothetical protein
MIGITSTTLNTTIYYTTDGSSPTTNSPLYTEPFQINNTTTIKTLATKSGLTDSEITTKDYTRTGMPLLCWQFTARRKSGRIFVINGDGVHPTLFTVPLDVDIATCCLVDEGLEVDRSKYNIEVIS